MANELTESERKAITELSAQRYSTYYSWLRHILLMASGLIGILISLHTKKSESLCEHYSFVLTIGLLGLGILTGSISLYDEIHSLDRHRKVLAEAVAKRLKHGTSYGQISVIDRAKIFILTEWICYLSFALSLVSLIVYAVLVDK
jgi:hypothetical protein